MMLDDKYGCSYVRYSLLFVLLDLWALDVITDCCFLPRCEHWNKLAICHRNDSVTDLNVPLLRLFFEKLLATRPDEQADIEEEIELLIQHSKQGDELEQGIGHCTYVQNCSSQNRYCRK